MTLIFMVDNKMCPGHNEPHVETLYLFSLIYICCCNILIKVVSEREFMWILEIINSIALIIILMLNTP